MKFLPSGGDADDGYALLLWSHFPYQSEVGGMGQTTQDNPLCSASHTSHALQPLDVGVFGSFTTPPARISWATMSVKSSVGMMSVNLPSLHHQT